MNPLSRRLKHHALRYRGPGGCVISWNQRSEVRGSDGVIDLCPGSHPDRAVIWKGRHRADRAVTGRAVTQPTGP